jgi:hypothetical protein
MEIGNNNEKSFSWKRFFHTFVSSAALAVTLLIAIWIIDYFNAGLQLEFLSKINGFLITFWWVLAAFVLLISLWDYLFTLFHKKLKYFKPLIDAIGLIFGFWLVASILYGLTFFVQPESNIILFLTFMHDIFYQLNILLFLLFLLVSYAKFLLSDK